MRIYFDNASTTPLLPDVAEVMYEAMKNNFGNPSSVHYYGRNAKATIEHARKKVANLLNASIGEIFFTSCATESHNAIITQSVEALGIKTIIYSQIEHHCIFHTVDHLVNKGRVKAIRLGVDKNGNIDLEELASLLKENGQSTLVSVMHGNNEIGVINDIKKIGELCKENGALFHSDTVQTLGKYPIDFHELNIDFAAGSAHKFFGPKGVGFMYVNQNAIIPPFIHGGAQERNMRSGTENLYGILGLAKALEIAHNEMDVRHEKVLALKKYFEAKLLTHFHDIHINGGDNTLYNILSVSFPPSPKADMLMFNLDIAGVCVSSASACSSGIEIDSHVLQAIGHASERKTVRFSFSHFNTKTEIDYTIDKLKSLTPLKK